MTLPRHLARGAANRQFPGRMLSSALRGAIRVYQLTLAYFFVGACRYEPSCSAYAAEAVSLHGAWHGSLLAVHRLCRCGPWCDGGYDPVPPAGARPGSITSSLTCSPAKVR